jgi:hypothetical protein
MRPVNAGSGEVPVAGQLAESVGSRRGRANDEEGMMSREYWTVVREPQGDESPYNGPFISREEAQVWADEQEDLGRKIYDIRKLDMPLGFNE